MGLIMNKEKNTKVDRNTHRGGLAESTSELPQVPSIIIVDIFSYDNFYHNSMTPSLPLLR